MLFYKKNTAAIFLFHRVSPQRDPMWDPMDPALFEKCLAYIRKNFTVCTLDAVIADPTHKGTKPKAAVTFDDGYRDFIDHALPLLDQYKVPASMFVTTGCIDSGQPVWTYIMDSLFYNTKKLSLKTGIELPALLTQTSWPSAAERIGFGKKIKQRIKYIPASERQVVIDCISNSFNDVQIPGNLMMNWEEIKSIHQNGVQVGAHSVTHPTMDTLENEEDIQFELSSGERIREMTGIEAGIFSYPNGSYDERVTRLAQQAGYGAALAVNKRPAYKGEDRFAISRIELYNESWFKTRMRLNGAISFIQKSLRS